MTRGQRIKKTVSTALKFAVYQVSSWFPRKKNLWLFGAWSGKLYADNTKYLFEYVNHNCPDIRAVWIAQDPQVVETVQAKGYEAWCLGSARGVWTSLRASVCFVTAGAHDIGAPLTGGAQMIQLWHGMGIKEVRALIPLLELDCERKYNARVYDHNRGFWMTACEDAVRKYSESYHVDPEHMFITGQPKDDTFVHPCHHSVIEQIRRDHSGCKVVAYLPTHRAYGQQSGPAPELTYDTFLKVNEMLKQHNIVMIFKPHMHEFKNYEGLNTDLSNIIFATDKNTYGDVYEFLPAADGLLTDYSGIMLGYLTANKPLFYFPYDYETYVNQDPGLYFPYDEVTAGPVCRTWEEVVEAMDREFACDNYWQRREELQKRFSPWMDGNNCQRVCEKVREIIS